MDKWVQLMDLSAPVNTCVVIDYDLTNEIGPRPWPYQGAMKERLEWASRAYQKRQEMCSWLEDDSVPALHPYTGTELFAQAFGCPVHESGDNMPFARPLLTDLSGLSRLKQPDVHSGVLGEVFELAERLRQRNGREALVQLPDIQSPVDIAALICEKSEFLVAMITDPEAVQALVEMTERTLTEFLDEWFKAFGTDYLAHFPNYFMRGGLTLSEDEVGAISGPLFEAFCLAPLNRLSQRYGGIGIHCCANARHQWTGFEQVEGLRLVNFVQPKPVIQEAYRRFAGRAVQMHSWCGDGEPSAQWADNYPREAHVVLNVGASTREQALERLAALREVEALRAR